MADKNISIFTIVNVSKIWLCILRALDKTFCNFTSTVIRHNKKMSHNRIDKTWNQFESVYKNVREYLL